jgi:hypothetical protein
MMMLSGLRQDERVEEIEKGRQKWKIQLDSECTINYFNFPIRFPLRFYLLYADSLKVLSLSLGIAPGRLLHRNLDLPMLVLVLHEAERGERERNCTIENYD